MTDEPERIKQVLLIRRDLGMRRGKEVAQGAHASMGFLAERLRPSDGATDAFTLTLSSVEQHWLAHGMAKICLRVNSEVELVACHEKARAAGLVSTLIRDSGRTEFRGEPTLTACAIGPDAASRIDAITGELAPY
jgi:PTH2 family peptidyl-tRNA hydrolase